MLLILEGHSFSLPQLALQLIVQHHPIDEAKHHGEEQERLQDPLLFSGTHPVSHSPNLGDGGIQVDVQPRTSAASASQHEPGKRPQGRGGPGRAAAIGPPAGANFNQLITTPARDSRS